MGMGRRNISYKIFNKLFYILNDNTSDQVTNLYLIFLKRLNVATDWRCLADTDNIFLNSVALWKNEQIPLEECTAWWLIFSFSEKSRVKIITNLIHREFITKMST